MSERPRRLPSAGFAGAVGNLVEWYDFAVLGSSATLLAAALTPGGDAGVTAVFLVFAVSFLVRPVGAVIGARWADTTGRRRPLIAAWATMSIATAAIGLLPSWATAGDLVIVALLVLRLLQGLSTGGELVVSVTYLLEHAPARHRGGWGGLHMATMAVGFAAGTAVVSALALVLPADALASWGWRVPFLLALPLGAAALLLRRRVLETPAYGILAEKTSEVWRGPLKALGPERGTVLRGFLLTGGFMTSFTLWFVYLPAHLSAAHAMSLGLTLSAAAAGLVVMAASAAAFGRLSDEAGRRPVIAFGLAVATASWVTAYPAVEGGPAWLLVATSAVMGVGLGAVVLQSALAEAFPAPLRAAGIAATVGLASALVGATAPLVGDRLVRVAPALVTAYAVVWLAVAGWATLTLGRAVAVDADPWPSGAPD